VARAGVGLHGCEARTVHFVLALGLASPLAGARRNYPFSSHFAAVGYDRAYNERARAAISKLRAPGGEGDGGRGEGQFG
jgi:hypothetical protein